jgi:hypothetical protein
VRSSETEFAPNQQANIRFPTDNDAYSGLPLEESCEQGYETWGPIKCSEILE